MAAIHIIIEMVEKRLFLDLVNIGQITGEIVIRAK